MKTLFDYQENAISRLRSEIAGGNKRPMLQLPTGAGKTLVAAEITKRAWQNGKRVVFVIDALSLIGQTSDAFYEHGIDEIGVIQANSWQTDYSKKVQIASVQTLQRRGMPEADLIINDEAHILYDWMANLMAEDKWKHVPIIGLSATPWSKGLGNHYRGIIKPVGTRQLLARGRLKPLTVYAPSHPDLSGARTVAGDYHEEDIARVMGDATLIADTVKTWKEKGENRPTLAFCVNLDHAKAMQEAFIEAGVPWGYIDADVEAADRRAIQGQLDRGEIYGVASCGTLVKGIDWIVGCIILARPTKSKQLLVQIMGRGMRTDDHHADCIVLDHTDSILRLGFPEDIDDSITRLCTAQKGERTNIEQERQPPKPRECPVCSSVIPPAAEKCPSCGSLLRIRGQVTVGEGSLSELTGGRESSIRTRKKETDPARIYGELKGYQILKKKSDAWLNSMHKAKTGDWPNYSIDVKPIAPSPETLSWIRSRNIAWAKSKKR